MFSSRSIALLSLSIALGMAGCSLITNVDRNKANVAGAGGSDDGTAGADSGGTSCAA
jgi:dihydroxyacetone kinase DhaKLM complex PTS-EIIA-like component DhaM